MRKTLLTGCVLVLAMATLAAAQPGPKLGVGAFAGLNFPALQDDQSQGMEYGFRGRVGFGSLFVVEPYVSFVKWGEPDPAGDVDLGIDGSKVTSFGIEAMLGNLPGVRGFAPFFFAGFGSYKVENEDTGYEGSKLGWSAGLGVGFGLSPQISLDVRGRAMIAPQEEGGSKKGLGVIAGINYSLGGE